jgi:hypothetical protein
VIGEPTRAGSTVSGTPADDAPERPWASTLAHLQVQDLAIRYVDEAFDAPIAYAGRLDLSLGGVNRAAREPMRLEARLSPEAGGSDREAARASIAGTIDQDGRRANARLEIQGFPLVGLQPALGHYTTLVLRSGAVSMAGQLRYDADADSPLVIDSNLAIVEMRIDEEESEERLLAWRRLVTDALSLRWGPGSPLSIASSQLRIDAPSARLHVSQQRELNLPSVLRAGKRKGADMGNDKPPPRQAPARLAVRIDRIDLLDGTVDFTDESLVLPFSNSIVGFNGTVVGISSEPGTEAILKAEGRVEPFGHARTAGRLLPSAPTRFTDIRVEFDNVSLPLLSPYTATFAGRTIEAGRIWLDLRYRIVDGDLAGDNRIRIANLRLGERVMTRDALDLPLELAIGLLTDETGQITIDIPVSGEVGNVQFDYGALVSEAIRSTLQRIVSAPFRFLADLGGAGREERLDGVSFEPGQDRLMPQQQEVLARLAVAMTQRPAIAITVEGVYDASLDGWALREAIVRRDVVRAAGTQLQADEPTGPIGFDQPGIAQAIERLLTQRDGETLVASIRDVVAARRDEHPDALDWALYARLVQGAPLDPAALQSLANRRAQSVRDHLVLEQGLAETRISIGKVIEVTTDDGPIVAPLSLAGPARG